MNGSELQEVKDKSFDSSSKNIIKNISFQIPPRFCNKNDDHKNFKQNGILCEYDLIYKRNIK